MAHSLALLLVLALAIGVAKPGGATRIRQAAVFGEILVGLILARSNGIIGVELLRKTTGT